VFAVYTEANCKIFDDLNMDTVKAMGLTGAEVVYDLVNGVFSYHVCKRNSMVPE
jgi:hypothetical protein